MILGRTLESWCASYPLIRELVALQETTWFNPGVAPVAQALGDVGLSAADVADASARLARFASFLERAFPETAGSGGIIESDIVPLTHLQPLLAERYSQPLTGALWLKRDSHLPISGSIKARGGIYEVLKHAEDLALAGGLLTLDDDYALLHSDKARAFLASTRSPWAPPATLACRSASWAPRWALMSPCICRRTPGNGRKTNCAPTVSPWSSTKVTTAWPWPRVASRQSPTRPVILSTMKTRSICSSVTPWPASA
jgi:D-serine dehydratase